MLTSGIAGGVVLVCLALAILGAMATAWLMRRRWLKKGMRPTWGAIFAGLIAAFALFGVLGTMLGLVKAFGAVGGESVDPSQKARILAEGISEAMNYAALGFVAWLLMV